jgi:hypothetical protein
VDVPSDLPQSEWPRNDPAGGGWVQLANGTHLLFDGRAPGPRVFQANGTTGKVYLFSDMRQVQLWRRSTESGIVDLEPGPLQTPAQGRSYALTQMGELLDILDSGGQASCDDLKASRALEMMLALHLSHRSGGAKVRLPLTDRDFRVDTV